MRNEIEKILNDISENLVLLDSTDEIGISEITKSLETFADKLGAAKEFQRLEQSCRKVLAQHNKISNLEFVEQLNNFISKAQSFLNSPDKIKLPFEDVSLESIETSSNAVEYVGELDQSLVIEFIERYNTLLEECESVLVDYNLNLVDEGNKNQDKLNAEFQAYIKGFIHSLKGDAGSVGLIGIERLCHELEDEFIKHAPHLLIDQLALLKEWLAGFVNALSNGTMPEESSERFLEKIKNQITELNAAHTPVVELTPEMEVKTEKSNNDIPINLDLLAQVMNDPTLTSAAEPVPTAPSKANDVQINMELLAMVMNDTTLTSAPAVEEKKVEVVVEETHKPELSTNAYKLTGEVEIFLEFAVEAEDHVNIVETTVLEAEGNYTSDSINTIFRGIHSIKGASSYFNLKEIAETAHITESVLDEVRTNKRKFDQELTDIVLTFCDLQKKLLEASKRSLTNNGFINPNPESAVYLRRITAYQKGGAAAVANLGKEVKIAPRQETAIITEDSDKSEKANAGEKLDIKSYVKIDTQRLDLLIDAIGEMCIYSSMLIQNTRTLFAGNELLIKTTHQVEKFSRDLQSIGMSMRLIPIRGLFQKMSRLIWDTSKKINKEVKFVMEGEDTELDRTIIEKLADPLMHMVRNAIDHGVETPDVRQSVGKPRAGNVSLSAYHAGGSIHIRLKDDGAGLDPDKLIRKAIEKGILPDGAKLPREEAFQLIFAPGFSTASVVTDISGRGVGMDVVRRNIESMRGRVHIDSTLGKGTTFTIELPLTLAIIDGIEARVGNDQFILPTLSIVEFTRPTADQITKTLDKGETYHFRGKYLPVYHLSKLFGVNSEYVNIENSTFVVVESSGEMAVIVVDEIIGSYSTVIKSLGETFEDVEGVAGCAIVSNGNISLILDIRSLLINARDKYDFKGIMKIADTLNHEMTNKNYMA